MQQMGADQSQLLCGYSDGTVITWHLSDSKIHRKYVYPITTTGTSTGPRDYAVTALTWEPHTAESFAVGYANGVVLIWKRKQNTTPHLTIRVSSHPGPHAAITRLYWSTHTHRNQPGSLYVAGGMPIDAESSGVTGISESRHAA